MDVYLDDGSPLPLQTQGALLEHSEAVSRTAPAASQVGHNRSPSDAHSSVGNRASNFTKTSVLTGGRNVHWPWASKNWMRTRHTAPSSSIPSRERTGVLENEGEGKLNTKYIQITATERGGEARISEPTSKLVLLCIAFETVSLCLLLLKQ